MGELTEADLLDDLDEFTQEVASSQAAGLISAEQATQLHDAAALLRPTPPSRWMHPSIVLLVMVATGVLTRVLAPLRAPAAALLVLVVLLLSGAALRAVGVGKLPTVSMILASTRLVGFSALGVIAGWVLALQISRVNGWLATRDFDAPGLHPLSPLLLGGIVAAIGRGATSSPMLRTASWLARRVRSLIIIALERWHGAPTDQRNKPRE